jgi:hypothetical protein
MSFADGPDRTFRHVLVELDGALAGRGCLALTSLPSTADSPWTEGNVRLSIAQDRIASVSTKTGRGLWLDLQEREVLTRYDAAGQTPPAPAGTPGLWASDAEGRILGVLGATEAGRRFVSCRQLVAADTGEDLATPTDWEVLSEYRSPCANLHHPWIHHIESLGGSRWLVAVSTDGSVRSAYPSKSMPFAYAVVDASGAQVGQLDHAAASAQRPVNVYADVGSPLFPSDLHPFYRPVVDLQRQRVWHKLLDQLLCFDCDGNLVEQVDFKEKGLSGLRKFELQAVSREGVALFRHAEHSTLWSTPLVHGPDLRKELVAGLKAYRKEHKALGGGRLSVGVLGDDAWTAEC